MTSIKEKFNELVDCLRQNSAEKAKRIVTETPELLSYKDDSERLPIHWACVGGCLPFVEYSISDNLGNINATDETGWTPLMIAASAGRFDVCRFLVGSPHCEVNHR